MEPNDGDFVYSRTFDAPRDLVWKAWTEAERLEKWWGPKGFTLTVAKLELQPGGVFHYRMTSAQGHEMWGKFIYSEIDAPKSLSYLSSFSDPEGNTARAPMIENFPLQISNVLTFDETADGKTIVTLHGRPTENATDAERTAFLGMHQSMNMGFGGTFDQLDTYLAETKKG